MRALYFTIIIISLALTSCYKKTDNVSGGSTTGELPGDPPDDPPGDDCPTEPTDPQCNYGSIHETLLNSCVIAKNCVCPSNMRLEGGNCISIPCNEPADPACEGGHISETFDNNECVVSKSCVCPGGTTLEGGVCEPVVVENLCNQNGNNSVHLQWESNPINDEVIDFAIHQKLEGENSFSPVDMEPVIATQSGFEDAVVGGLTSGLIYEFTVTARNLAGPSGYAVSVTCLSP